MAHEGNVCLATAMTVTTETNELEAWTTQHWSRHEWFYMWSRGLDPRRIAAVCRVPYRKVYDYIRGRVTQKPELFGRRLVVHDQPALPRSGLVKRRSWEERCEELAEFRRRHGRFPHNYKQEESSLYSFLQYQRTRYRAGKLPEARGAFLNKQVPGWLTPRKRDRETALWQQRADELREFLTKHGRCPSYKIAKEPHEAALSTWLTAQRRSLRRGRLDEARTAHLEEVFHTCGQVATVLLPRARDL